MPLPDFIEQILAALATDDPEVIVDAIRPLRDNPGATEHGFFEAFNRSIIDNPVPVGVLETRADVVASKRDQPNQTG